jgi:hypothetical protein
LSFVHNQSNSSHCLRVKLYCIPPMYIIYLWTTTYCLHSMNMVRSMDW